MGLFTKRVKNNPNIETESRETSQKRIIAAMIAGRHLSMYDNEEFGTAEMHTQFCYIRKKIADRKITGWTMKDVWRTNENGIKYKEYWFERENG